MEKKEKQVSSVEKLVVVKAIMEKSDQYTFDELKCKKEGDLFTILEREHKKIENNIDNKYEFRLEEKFELLKNSLEKYDNHKSKITNQTLRNFATSYSKFKKSETSKYELDFASIY